MTSDQQNPSDGSCGLPFPVVGLGASAGGLAALIALFESMPATPGMAFVVVMHLSPKHESNAAAILQRCTRMPVAEITDELKIEANHIYVIPPTRSVVMDEGLLRLGSSERVRGGHVVIDRFFRSLAQAHKERAIAIVLSGTGVDGAVGIGEIKELGGVVLAQSPEDAEYIGMPSSAIASGRVDIVLPVAEMAQKLLDIWKNAQSIELPQTEDDLPVRHPKSGEDAEGALLRIMALLQSTTGHDFKHYKRATVLRRIERRLQVNGLPHLPAYADFLQKQPEEVPRLLADMLIGVTNFFRDRDAFEALERQVIPELFDASMEGKQLRVWVPGCSSGEEAYSLAMLLVQESSARSGSRPIQLFATDIDAAAVARGRDALYPESIVTDIAPAILRRYFIKDGLNYRVARPLRELVLFAAHNVLRDPPFSRVDLISCRNLLIYLEREVQAEVLQMFHFALRPGGYLFLGSSETADATSKLFTVVDKEQHIYRANSTARPARSLPRFPLGNQMVVGLPLASRTAAPRQSMSISEIHQRLLQEYVPPSIVISEEGDILHIARAERYLRFPAGVPSPYLLSVILPELRPALRAAMFDLDQSQTLAQASARMVAADSRPYQVTIQVRTVPQQDWSRDLRLILFHEIEDKLLTASDSGSETLPDPLITRLQEELQRKDVQLQRSIDQYEVSVEDLKASNGELQAINEELRSATEELETSKEELQSTNEELITVNQELKTKVDETVEANDDLRNLIAATGIATIFLERDMRIKRFTPSAEDLFNIRVGDIGRSLMDITHRLDYDDLAADAADTFSSLRTVEREVRSLDGRTFLARLLPYRTAEDRIDGAVLSFIDVTALRSAQHSVHMDQERMQLIANSLPGFAIMTMDEEGRFTSWSIGAKELFGYEEDEVLGQPFDLIFTSADREANAPTLQLQVARQAGRSNDESWYLRRDGSRFFSSGTMTLMRLGRLKGFTKIVRDMTLSMQDEIHRSATMESVVKGAPKAHSANDLKDEFLAVMSHELKHPLNLVQVSAQMLMAMPETQSLPRVLKAAGRIQDGVKSQARIIDDLLDLTRTRAGKLVLSIAPVYLKEALQSCFDWAAIQAGDKGIRFSLDAADDDLLVEADLTRLRQIIMNLLSNALKFTPSGGQLTVQLGNDGSDAVLRVIDSGRGISPRLLPHVFEMFKQGDSQTTRQDGGLGIGLALVRELVNLHGGRVSAQSDGEGRGATFSVCLPLKRNTDFGLLEDHTPVHLLTGLRILLVEDSVDALDAFAMLLELEGVEVAKANSGAQALVLADQRDFDLIISDIGMPEMDGYMLIRELRERPRTANVIAIALTGYGRAEDVNRSMELGFDAHLDKPVDIKKLRQVALQFHLFPGARSPGERKPNT